MWLETEENGFVNLAEAVYFDSEYRFREKRDASPEGEDYYEEWYEPIVVLSGGLRKRLVRCETIEQADNFLRRLLSTFALGSNTALFREDLLRIVGRKEAEECPTTESTG